MKTNLILKKLFTPFWRRRKSLRRKVFFWLRKKYRPLTSRGSLLVLGISFIFLGLSFFGSNFAVKLIYDPEIKPIIPRWLLTIAIISPVALIYLNFLVLTRIVIDRLRQKIGTMLRFRIVGFFLISLTVPSVFFIVLFLKLYDYTVNIFNNELLLNQLEENLSNVTSEFQEEMHYMETSLTLLSNEFSIGKVINLEQLMQTPLRRDGILIFYKNGRPKQILFLNSILSELEKLYQSTETQQPSKEAASNFTLKTNIPNFNFSLLLEDSNTYSSYNEESGFFYALQKVNTGDNHLALISTVGAQKKENVNKLLSSIAELRQFQLLTGPLRIAFLFTVFYFYLQVFSISVLIFYQRSNKYLSPIQDLIEATKSIAYSSKQKNIVSSGQTNKAIRKINDHLQKMDEDEIYSLLHSFRQMAIELQQNRKRIQYISEIEGWKEVAKRIAHEIKNPLTPIQLSINSIDSEISKINLETYEKLLPSINLINQEITRIEQLAGELSELSKVQQLSKKMYNFTHLLKKVSTHFSYRKDITINVSKTQLPLLFIDEEKIYSIFINIIKNSLHAIDSLSKQQLQQKDAKHIFITSKIIRFNKKRYAEISITDSGIGISTENQDEIFKPYFTLKKSGTGLGLAICQQIAFAHDGNLWLKTSTNKKTTFILLLPLIQNKEITNNSNKLLLKKILSPAPPK